MRVKIEVRSVRSGGQKLRCGVDLTMKFCAQPLAHFV